jgi:hypothetical protein
MYNGNHFQPLCGNRSLNLGNSSKNIELNGLKFADISISNKLTYTEIKMNLVYCAG